MPIHKDLAAGRWFTLSYAEQLGNIGSEVERTIKAVEAGNAERKERALARMFELFDLTLADPRHAERQAELDRLRALLADVFTGGNVSGTTHAWLREYFLEWGMKARAGR